MRAVAYLAAFASLAFAAPVPKELKPPPVELLAPAGVPEARSDRIRLTLRNNGRVPLEVVHVGMPVAPFSVELRDAKGERVPYHIPEDLLDTLGVSSTVAPPSGSTEIELSIYHYHFDGRVRPGGKLTAVIRWKHDDREYTSNPVVLGE